MKNKIRMAIIGCGGIARAAHMKQYRNIPNCGEASGHYGSIKNFANALRGLT